MDFNEMSEKLQEAFSKALMIAKDNRNSELSFNNSSNTSFSDGYFIKVLNIF